MRPIKNYGLAISFVMAIGVFYAPANDDVVDLTERNITNSEDRCNAEATITLKNGDKVTLTGSCGSVHRKIKKAINATENVVLMKDHCKSAVIRLRNGSDTVTMIGSCRAIRREIRKYKRDGFKEQ